MKIIQIITLGHEYYGAQSHVLELSDELQNMGHEVLVLVGTSGALSDRLTARGLSWQQVDRLVHRIRPLQDLRAVVDLCGVIRNFKPDIVATHSSKAGIVGRIAARLCGVPSTFTAHGWSFADGVPAKQRRLALFLERATARVSDRIIAVANNERDFGLQHKVAPADKIVTIHYGTEDKASAYPQKHKDSTSASDPIRLTMVAGFRKQKDHQTLIKALAEIKSLPWKLDLLGDGELRSEIESAVRSADLQEHVRFHGAVDNVTDFLHQTDILVLTTNWEGLPISTIEGLSFSLPVVATAVAGTKEQVIDGYNGITVERGDAPAVRSALVTLIRQPALRAEYGANSRTLFEKQFLLSSMVEKTLQVYATILQSRSESAG